MEDLIAVVSAILGALGSAGIFKVYTKKLGIKITILIKLLKDIRALINNAEKNNITKAELESIIKDAEKLFRK